MSQVPSFANIEDYRHSIISIPRRQSSLSIPRGSIVASHLSIARGSIVASHLSIGPRSKLDEEITAEEDSKALWDTLQEMLNFALLKNKLFLLICLSNVLGMLGFYTPFVYLPNMAVLRGIPVEDANFLISIIGISNTVGRVLAGWISDFKWVNSQVVTILAILLSGVSVFVLPFCNSYATFVTIALLFGLFVAAYISLTSIVLVDLLGLDNLTSAFGLLVLFRGVSSMVGPPVAGSVYDATQSYDISFYMAGVFLILAGVVNLAVELLHRRGIKATNDVKASS